ncbi:MAG: hypothetical protein ACXWID_17140 [Pyrinomonadaceae bacterium]
MKILIYLSLLLTLVLPAPAQQSPVPIENEPRHPLKFENQYVRVFNVFIPVGKTTLFHIHKHDAVGIRLTDSRIKDEPQEGAPAETSFKRGEVSFAYRPSPLIHRVSNIGSTDFRNIFVEILPQAPGASTTAVPLENVAGYTVAVENNRVRVLRLVLAPGQSTGMRAHVLPTLSVAVTKGKIVIETSDKKPRTKKFKPGETEWREVGAKYSLKNIGSAPFEIIDIELK